MSRPTCGTCHHYVTNPAAVSEGMCCFNPPVVFLVMTERGPLTPTAFPGVSAKSPGYHHHPQIGENPAINGLASLRHS